MEFLWLVWPEFSFHICFSLWQGCTCSPKCHGLYLSGRYWHEVGAGAQHQGLAVGQGGVAAGWFFEIKIKDVERFQGQVGLLPVLMIGRPLSLCSMYSPGVTVFFV